jgi:hypothetical protein
MAIQEASNRPFYGCEPLMVHAFCQTWMPTLGVSPLVEERAYSRSQLIWIKRSLENIKSQILYGTEDHTFSHTCSVTCFTPFCAHVNKRFCTPTAKVFLTRISYPRAFYKSIRDNTELHKFLFGVLFSLSSRQA